MLILKNHLIKLVKVHDVSGGDVVIAAIHWRLRAQVLTDRRRYSTTNDDGWGLVIKDRCDWILGGRGDIVSLGPDMYDPLVVALIDIQLDR